MLNKPCTAAAAACLTLLASVESALAAPAGENTPLDLKETPTVQSGGSNGGGLVRTFVGLAVVIGVIYGLYWVLKQVKASREESASGSGLTSLATLPLGPNRSLHMIRAGREVVIVGVSEGGVRPIRTYSEADARSAGLFEDGHDNASSNGSATSTPGFAAPNEALRNAIDGLRRRTVRS